MTDIDVDEIHLCPLCNRAVRANETISIVNNGSFAMLAHEMCEKARPTKQEWEKGQEPGRIEQEWKGGLPPVGVDCEVFFRDDDNPHWFAVEYHGMAHGKLFLYDVQLQRAFVPDSDSFEFRPLKSQQERHREELIKVISDCDEMAYSFRPDDIADAVIKFYEEHYNLEPKP